MAFNLDILDVVDQRIRSSRSTIITPGTAVTSSGFTTNDIVVMMEGSTQAVPAKAYANFFIREGDRVGLVKFGSVWTVVATYGRNMAVVAVADPIERDELFPSTAVPAGHPVYVASTDELEAWDGAKWVGLWTRVAEKTFEQNFDDTFTPANVTGVVLSMEPAERYLLLGEFIYEQPIGTGDALFEFDVPANASGQWSFIGPRTTTASPYGEVWLGTLDFNGGQAGAGGIAGIDLRIPVKGIIHSGDGGDIQMKACSLADSGASDRLRIEAGTYISLRKV